MGSCEDGLPQLLKESCAPSYRTIIILFFCFQAQVMRDKSVENMPLSLSASSLINSMVWTAYGIIAKDIFVIVQSQYNTLQHSALSTSLSILP